MAGGYNAATKLAAQKAAMLKVPTPEAAMDMGRKKGESG
jgi:hypothetical protein